MKFPFALIAFIFVSGIIGFGIGVSLSQRNGGGNIDQASRPGTPGVLQTDASANEHPPAVSLLPTLTSVELALWGELLNRVKSLPDINAVVGENLRPQNRLQRRRLQWIAFLRRGVPFHIFEVALLTNEYQWLMLLPESLGVPSAPITHRFVSAERLRRSVASVKWSTSTQRPGAVEADLIAAVSWANPSQADERRKLATAWHWQPVPLGSVDLLAMLLDPGDVFVESRALGDRIGAVDVRPLPMKVTSSTAFEMARAMDELTSGPVGWWRLHHLIGVSPRWDFGRILLLLPGTRFHVRGHYEFEVVSVDESEGVHLYAHPMPLPEFAESADE